MGNRTPTFGFSDQRALPIYAISPCARPTRFELVPLVLETTMLPLTPRACINCIPAKTRTRTKSLEDSCASITPQGQIA